MRHFFSVELLPGVFALGVKFRSNDEGLIPVVHVQAPSPPQPNVPPGALTNGFTRFDVATKTFLDPIRLIPLNDIPDERLDALVAALNECASQQFPHEPF